MTATERSMTLKSALRCLGIKAVREFGELLRVSSSDTGPASFCGQGYYCAPGGSMEPCAVHQTSPAGATSCSCETGYELQAATGTCFQCPADFYCPSLCWVRMPSGCDRALSETKSPQTYFVDPSTKDADTCSARLAAFNAHCMRSDAVSVWGNVVEDSAGLSHAGEDCWGGCSGKQGLCSWCGTGLCCRYGWSDTSNGCDGTVGIEGKGHVCAAPLPTAADPMQISCGDHAESPPGSTASNACVCASGYYDSGTKPDGLPTCVQCPAGSYCPGGSADPSVIACPLHSTSAAGAVESADCVCDGGYHGAADACTLCPENYFCNGGSLQACPAHMNSGTGATTCACDLGYELKSDGTCFLCPVNHYCPALCWMRMPSGCARGLSETSTPKTWFVDPGTSSSDECFARVDAFNNHCQKGDAEEMWGSVAGDTNSEIPCGGNAESPR